jgi:hypothetical protein
VAESDKNSMEKLESIKNLAGALCKFQGEMRAISKDSAIPYRG